METDVISYVDLGENEEFQENTWYFLNVEEVHACVYTQTLQIIFSLKKEYKGKTFFLLQNYPMNSDAYMELIKCVYSTDYSQLIEVNTSDFFEFSCYCMIKRKNNLVLIDWPSMQICTRPENDLGIRFCLK